MVLTEAQTRSLLNFLYRYLIRSCSL